jgi:hypothetical protein
MQNKYDFVWKEPHAWDFYFHAVNDWKVKFPLCLRLWHKGIWVVDMKFHAFLTSAFRWRWVVNFTLQLRYLWGKNRKLGGTQNQLDKVERRTVFAPAASWTQFIKPRSDTALIELPQLLRTSIGREVKYFINCNLYLPLD